MQRLWIKQTSVSPEIDCNPITNRIKIRGISYPENSLSFYKPVFEWIDAYVTTLQSAAVVEIQLDYFNTSSTRCLVRIFEILDIGYKNQKDLCVKWYYDEENDELKESAEEFKEDLNIPFEIIPLK